MAQKKRFFSKHSKSSAALVSLGIHVALVVVAISFVAVSVIQKDEQQFEPVPVDRPKMQLRKLTVPVNVQKKKVQKPKLRKRITVKPKKTNSPDIKMPEISGVKGGLGNIAGDGLGGAGGVGFSMPKVEIFGVKGKGEKIFLILDTGNSMLVDEMGGIPAYTIIKEELIRIVESLPSTALVNVGVYHGNGVRTAFPQLVSATPANAAKVREWLEPLNASDNAANSGRYGLKTLSGGQTVREDLRIGAFAEPVKKGGAIYAAPSTGIHWYTAVMMAHKQQADTIFLLTNSWGSHKVAVNTSMTTEEWIATTSAGKRWAENVEKAKKMLEAENAKRKASGQPPKVLSGGRWALIREYFPGTEQPPRPEYYNFTPKQFAEAFLLLRDKFKGKSIPMSSGLAKRSKKSDFSFNVVEFIPKDGQPGRASNNFKQLTGFCGGEYQTVSGLEEIQNYVSGNAQ